MKKTSRKKLRVTTLKDEAKKLEELAGEIELVKLRLVMAGLYSVQFDALHEMLNAATSSCRATHMEARRLSNNNSFNSP